jgi:two-component system, chemotaxis family, protein-glutamate methylesterase/glutaminase
MEQTSTARRTLRVMVVDDSAVIRELISDALTAQPGFQVVAKARSGQEALKFLTEFQPDVVTLDIQMPGMDGLQTLEEILRIRPVPVIMVSALTQLGANYSLDALDRGAMDYVGKPESMIAAESIFRDELPRKLRLMGSMNVARMMQLRKERAARMKTHTANLLERTSTAKSVPLDAKQHDALNNKCIAIGISTGGPPALTSLFSSITAPQPPIVVVQHMPAQFTKPFAWRLNSQSVLTIKEAEAGDVLQPNHVYIAPGGKHMVLQSQGPQVRVTLNEHDLVSGHRPSVDVMMTSAAKIFGANCLGVVMTGMGRDGSDGCKAIRAAGGYVLGQDESSSDVYGMNKVAMVEGNVDKQFALDEAANIITTTFKRVTSRSLLQK